MSDRAHFDAYAGQRTAYLAQWIGKRKTWPRETRDLMKQHGWKGRCVSKSSGKRLDSFDHPDAVLVYRYDGFPGDAAVRFVEVQLMDVVRLQKKAAQ